MIQEELVVDVKTPPKLTEIQVKFIRHCASELTYQQIADKMNVSLRTVDGYRDDVFKKLNLKSRVGLVLYAIQNGIVNVETQPYYYVLEKLVTDLEQVVNKIKAELKS